MASEEQKLDFEKPPKSIIGSFFRRMRSRSRSQERKVHANGVTPEVTPSRSHDALTTKQRSKSTSFPTKEDSNDVNRNSKKWGAKQLLNRMSFRSRERIRSEKDSSPPTTPVQRHVGFASETDLFRPGAEVSFPSPMMDSPRGVSAVSDLDLRFVTMRRDFNADLGDSTARAFMSENDLTSSAADFDMPARTPSYLRISKALNGYTKSPVRKPETEAKQMMGESIVERRLRMFDHPHEKTGVVDDFASPVTTSKSHSNTDFSRSPIQPQTPISSRLQPSHMGNNFSTPGPIRDLISRFDKLDLCNFEKSKEDEKDTENIPPHSIVINQQPDFEEEACKKPVEIDDTTDTNSENPHETDNPPPSRISIDVESDSGISGSGNYSPESTKRDGEPATAANINATLQNISGQVAQSPKSIDLNPHDGEGFAKLHDFVRDDLSAKIEAAKEDLENVKDMPEACADLVRTAAGNGHLLVRKKISTFNGLVQKHLHPVVGDPMPVLLADLEAFWVTIDMELTGINKQFEKIEQYRKAGWNMEAVEETTSTETTPKASTAAPPVPKKSRLPTKKSPALSAEAQEKLDKQRALANERRAKAMAEMRARGKQQQKTSVEPAAADIEC